VMTEVLKETYGIMVYQEQVSRLVNRLGGIELKQAFRLAKAISKKKTSMIEAMRQPFIGGAVANGVPGEVADQVFEDILRFGGYAFNKAHSTGYALLAYKTAYMKVYFPTEYMAALLTFEMIAQDKVVEYIEECRRMKIRVRPPDVNVSENDFTVVSSTRGRAEICFGLGAIKGVGEKAVAAIMAARGEGGPFRSLFDFCKRVDMSVVNRAVNEALIKCGAFDSTGAMRGALITVLDDAIASGASLAADRRAGQMSLFGDGLGDPVEPKIPDRPQWSEAEMLAHEKATLGFYVTRHPLTSCENMLRTFATTVAADLKRYEDGAEVTLGGLITKMRTVLTKSGRNAGSKMGIVQIEDLSGQIEAIVFPRDLEQWQGMLKLDTVVFLRGQVDRRRENPSLRVSDVVPLDQAADRLSTMVLIRIVCPGNDRTLLQRIREVLDRYPGDRPVFLEMVTSAEMKVTIRVNGRGGVKPSDAFRNDMEQLVGANNVHVLGPTRKGLTSTEPVIDGRSPVMLTERDEHLDCLAY